MADETKQPTKANAASDAAPDVNDKREPGRKKNSLEDVVSGPGQYVPVGAGESLETFVDRHYADSIEDAVKDRKPDDEAFKYPNDNLEKLRIYNDAKQQARIEHADRLFQVNMRKGLLSQRHITATGQAVFVPDKLHDRE